VDDLIDSTGRYPDVVGESVLGDSGWLKEIGLQDLSRVDWRVIGCGHVSSSHLCPTSMSQVQFFSEIAWRKE